MDRLYQTYLDNLTRAFDLSKPQIASDMSDEQIIRVIRENADALFHIHQENDDILNQILFSRKGETLTDQEAESLKELAGALFNYNRSPDMGIAYYIHRLLYDYAQYHQDLDLTIRELYYQGITLLYMNLHHSDSGTDMFSQQVGDFFMAGAAYMDRYEELTSPETRAFVLRCLGNTKYASRSRGGASTMEELREDWPRYMSGFTRAMEVFYSPHYRRLDPELPWEHYIYTMHYDRVKYLSALRSVLDPEVSAAVLESAEYVYRNQAESAKAKEKNVGVRTQYVYSAARYHAGIASAEELMEALFQICEGGDLHDFSGDNIWAILYCPEYLLFYSKHLPPERQKALRPRLDEVLRRQREFLFLLPKNEYATQVSESVQAIASYVPEEDEGFSNRLLDYILACHPPTYVHSNMVAILARRVCEELLRKDPQRLRGVFGIQSVQEHEAELLESAYQSGLYHDLGKCMILSYVGLYTRRLLNEEFACIKLHTVFGCTLLSSLDMEDISSVSHYHHCTYDGTGGYPLLLTTCPQRVRPIVDMITVVDSLDAGTDNVGRSYAAAKTYGQIVSELRQGKGTRYAPYIVELFDDPAFYSELQRLIQDNRLQVYLNAYRGRDSSPSPAEK